jgi:hypothetical protein
VAGFRVTTEAVDEEVLFLYGFALLDLAIGVYVLGGL